MELLLGRAKIQKKLKGLSPSKKCNDEIFLPSVNQSWG